MKRVSLKSRILKYLRKKNAFIAGGQIEELARGAGYTGSTASRCCRQLVTDGELEVKHGKKRHSYYKAMPPKEVLTVGGKVVGGVYK